MRPFRPADYGPILAPLVSGDRNRALDRGSPAVDLHGALSLATLEAVFAQCPLADREMGACVLAGLWLVHDLLDESHAVSQTVDTPTGAFWHGIMHRREGDYANAKYWFRRAGRHEVLAALPARVPELKAAFDPLTFVDACQGALQTQGEAQSLCRRVQQAEWELLFDYSYRRAVGER
ncbi:MAG TPA: hypothetical protein VEQ85_04415 [Lacipirellulaceae bacterium]|nr:hypothetical protein [Lacipirellulaceae bacterium]